MAVNQEYKSKVTGNVIDVSQSGGNYFIKPIAVIRLQEELCLHIAARLGLPERAGQP